MRCSVGETDDIITATAEWARDGEQKHSRTDNLIDFNHGKVLIQAGKNQYEAETVVGIADSGEYVCYDVVDMKPTKFKVKEELSTTAAGKNTVSAIQASSANKGIRRSAEKSSRQNTETTKKSLKGSKEAAEEETEQLLNSMPLVILQLEC